MNIKSPNSANSYFEDGINIIQKCEPINSDFKISETSN